MPFSREEQEAIAGLSGLPAFQRLISALLGHEAVHLQKMAQIRSDRELLSAARYWQAFHAVVEFLINQPKSMRQELDTLEQEGGQSYDPVQDPMRQWAYHVPADAMAKPGDE